MSGSTLRQISEQTGRGYVQIPKILKHNGVTIKSFSDYRWIPTPQEKDDIISLYANRRGIDFIAKKYDIAWDVIQKWLKKWNVTSHSKSDLIKSNEAYYGRKSSFTFEGHKHSKESRAKISKSNLNNKNRTSTTGPKSRYIETVIGKVQGSYEVAYLQQHLEASGSLPSIGKAVNTPYGSYIPDFDLGNVFVEVKSPFTLEVCKGLRENQKGIKTDIQYKKIKWVDKNVKPVILTVLNHEEAMTLFQKAIGNKNLVTENIVYKHGKYYKQTPLLDNGL